LASGNGLLSNWLISLMDHDLPKPARQGESAAHSVSG
jgi:hypothetical protein